jgi:hypothetical protein
MAHPQSASASILNPPHRDAGEIHLDQRFLGGAFPALITLDDGCLDRLLAKHRHPEMHLARLCLEPAFVAAGPGIELRLECGVVEDRSGSEFHRR